MLKWVYANMTWFKMKLQQFSKLDSYSIKIQINNVSFFLPSRYSSLVISLKYIVLSLSLSRHEFFVVKFIN